MNFDSFRDWLKFKAVDECSASELEELDGLILVAIDEVRNRDSRRKAALEKMALVAKELGFSSIDEVFGSRAKTSQTSLRGERRGNSQFVSGARRPHMNPMDPNASDVWALNKVKQLPAWAELLLSQGWTIEELSYKNHARAMKARGLTPLYDAVQRHSEILAAEAPRVRRKHGMHSD